MFNSAFPLVGQPQMQGVRFAVPQGSIHVTALSEPLSPPGELPRIFPWQENEPEPSVDATAWVERLEFSLVPAVSLPLEGKGQ